MRVLLAALAATARGAGTTKVARLRRSTKTAPPKALKPPNEDTTTWAPAPRRLGSTPAVLMNT